MVVWHFFLILPTFVGSRKVVVRIGVEAVVFDFKDVFWSSCLGVGDWNFDFEFVEGRIGEACFSVDLFADTLTGD